MNLNELLPIKTEKDKGQPIHLINARDLFHFLESKQEFSHWFKKRVNEYDFIQDVDYFLLDKFITQKITKSQGGHNRTDYLITLEMAKELAMLERNQQGKLARRYFIQCEKTLSEIAPELLARLQADWQTQRTKAKKAYKPLNVALEQCLQRAGKLFSKVECIKESQMINTVLLGTHPRKWLKAQGKTGTLRSLLNAEQLDRLAFLEQADEMLLDSNFFERADRQARLATMYQNRYGRI